MTSHQLDIALLLGRGLKSFGTQKIKSTLYQLNFLKILIPRALCAACWYWEMGRETKDREMTKGQVCQHGESSEVRGVETLRNQKGRFFGEWIVRRPNGRRVSEAETGKEN